jgi:hypothetical protein
MWMLLDLGKSKLRKSFGHYSHFIRRSLGLEKKTFQFVMAPPYFAGFLTIHIRMVE